MGDVPERATPGRPTRVVADTLRIARAKLQEVEVLVKSPCGGIYGLADILDEDEVDALKVDLESAGERLKHLAELAQRLLEEAASSG